MPKNMTLTKAIIIFKNIESAEFSTDEKLTSLAMVLDMPTHNSITKDEMLKAFRWYGYTDTDSEPKTTANTAKNDLVNDIKQVKLCNNNDCTNCISCKYEDIAEALIKAGWKKP